MPTSNELDRIYYTLQTEYDGETLNHAAFLVISRKVTECFAKKFKLDFDKYIGMQDHGTVLMADDLDIDILKLRRASDALIRANFTIEYLKSLSNCDLPKPKIPTSQVFRTRIMCSKWFPFIFELTKMSPAY